MFLFLLFCCFFFFTVLEVSEKWTYFKHSDKNMRFWQNFLTFIKSNLGQYMIGQESELHCILCVLHCMWRSYLLIDANLCIAHLFTTNLHVSIRKLCWNCAEFQKYQPQLIHISVMLMSANHIPLLSNVSSDITAKILNMIIYCLYSLRKVYHDIMILSFLWWNC